MKRALVLAFVVACSKSAKESETATASTAPPDFVIINAHVYADVAADAVAVRGTKIAALGTTAALGGQCIGACKIVDAKGGFLQPGFHDAHAHYASAGRAETELVVRGGLPRMQEAVKAWAAGHPNEKWIIGRGWATAALPVLPTRADLDAVEPTRPVVLTDHSGHNIWVNSAALRAAGVAKATADPPGGKIVRDASGEPTGVFLDDAKELVTRHEPALTDAERAQGILAGEAMSLHAGCTAQEGGPVPLEVAKTYAALDAQGKLTQRAFLWAWLEAPEARFKAWVDFAHGLPKDGKVQIVAFKGFADGTLASSTAALLQPYADDPATKGPTYLEQEQLNRLVVRANQAGFPTAIHAIGDRAVRMSLDAFAHAKQVLGKTPMNRVEHASIVAPADVRRFGELGVAASVQPIWLAEVPSKSSWSTLKHVGPERIASIYPWASIHAAGALLLFGSDVPSSDEYDPVTGIFEAVERRFRNGEEFTPSERLDGDVSLKAYTLNPAVAIGWGDRIGKIAVGYEADLVLLDKDPRSGAKSLKEDPLRAMWIAGRPVTL